MLPSLREKKNLHRQGDNKNTVSNAVKTREPMAVRNLVLKVLEAYHANRRTN